MDEVTFVRKVQDAIEKRMHIDRSRTEEMIEAVFSALSARLTPREGENFVSQLPTAIKMLWHRKAFPRPALGEEAVMKLSKEQFLAKIETDGRLASAAEAEFIGRCVIHVLKEAISPGEIRDAADQLPSDLRGWLLTA